MWPHLIFECVCNIQYLAPYRFSASGSGMAAARMGTIPLVACFGATGLPIATAFGGCEFGLGLQPEFQVPSGRTARRAP
jgi:hypothetical protein